MDYGRAAELFAELRHAGLISTDEIARTGIDMELVGRASDGIDIEQHLIRTALLCAHAGASRERCRWLLEKMCVVLGGEARGENQRKDEDKTGEVFFHG